MKLIEPKFEIIEQAHGKDGLLKHIELCGRTCYKSYERITDGSAEKFVENMKSLGHGSVLEHGTVYLKREYSDRYSFSACCFVGRYTSNRYSFLNTCAILDNQRYYVVTTNYRVLLQGDYNTWDEAVANKFDKNWLSDLQYQCEPTEFHEKRVTVKFTTDIGISREFNRHRVNSISEESTRLCNYSRGRYGEEISVVPPIKARESASNIQNEYEEYHGCDDFILSEMCMKVSKLADSEWDGSKEYFTDIDTWLFANHAAQWAYMRLTCMFGWSAQHARSVLPLGTATELVHTAFVSDWVNFFNLRCPNAAHPMARELAIPLREEFIKRGLIKE